MIHYPQNEKEFKLFTRYNGVCHTHCTNCSMTFTNECNREPLEWVRACKEGICGKCFEEIVDHISGDSSV